jgi:hypothetical protein
MVLEHLLELCPECQATWSEFKAEHPGAFLEAEDDEDALADDDLAAELDELTYDPESDAETARRALLATNGHPEKSAPAEASSAEATAPPTASPYSAAFEKATAVLLAHAEHAARRQRPAQEEDEEAVAAAELAELLALPRGERPAALEAAPHRFRGRKLVEDLLAESFRQVRVDAEESLSLAEVAGAVLDRTPDAHAESDDPPAWAVGLSVRAQAYAANALRVTGDLRSAETALHGARSRLARFPSNDSRLHADLASLEASLCQDQRRLDDAESLLDRAAFLYREAGVPEGVAKVRVQQGAMLRVRGETSRAAETLREAVRLAASLGEERLQRDAVANLALTLCDADHLAAAEELIETHRALFATTGDRWTALRFVWLQGRIAAGLGDDGSAVAHLEEAWQGYLERGEGLNAALVCLDLAAVHAAAGRNAEVARLAAALGPVFAARDVGREATAALVLFQQAATADKVGEEMIRALRRQIERVRLQPAARLPSRPS